MVAWHWGLLATTVVVAVAASCAKGSAGDESSSSSLSGSPGGAAGAGGAGGSAGAGGAPCMEQACEIYPPQSGCCDGEQCHWMGTPVRECGPPGTKVATAACMHGECQIGHVCSAPQPPSIGGVDICHKVCVSDNDCTPPGGGCVFTVTGVGQICTHNCDPISDTGCNETSMKCYLLDVGNNQYRTTCGAQGPGISGSTCTFPSDCDAGMTCVTVNMMPPSTCLHWCNLAMPICPMGGNCSPLTPAVVLGVITYGVCVP